MTFRVRMQRSPFLWRYEKIIEGFILALLAAGPFAFLLGNTASDIWLGLIIGAAIDQLNRTLSWPRAFTPVLLATLFTGVWFVFVALLSDFQTHALLHAVKWLRFPIFALALSLLLISDARRQRVFFSAAVITILLLSGLLMFERLGEQTRVRLTGPWSQGPVIGMMLAALGLATALVCLEHSRRALHLLFAFVFSLIVLISVFNTGEIYSSLALLFGYGLFVIYQARSQRHITIALGFVMFAVATAAGFFVVFPAVWIRLTGQTLNRLPWRETSDYFPAWKTAFELGQDHLLLGTGPGTYFRVCDAVLKAEGSVYGYNRCFWHPHQIYLQLFAETGLIGLLLAAVLAALLLRLIWQLGSLGCTPRRGTPVILLVVAFWPISTFGDAFGQHRNFYLWLSIAIAIILAGRTISPPLVKTQAYSPDG